VSHYLDYAATSAVRPASVARSVATFLTECGGTPGRAGHRTALEAGRVTLRCRKSLCRLLGLPGDPGRLAFMSNATHALNTALWGTLKRGDAIVVSPYDHNAVLRPLHRIRLERGVEVRMLAGTPEGAFDPAEVDRLLDGATMLVINAASNVLGTRAPVRELAALAHGAGAVVLVDAAQSAGVLPVSHADEGADLIALTGHKGLLGPQGVGALWVRDGVDVEPLLRGGTGGESQDREMPAAMPDRLEAGTLNSPGIAGLAAGVEYLLGEGVATVHGRELSLKRRLRSGLEETGGVRVVSPPGEDGVGIVTVATDSIDPGTLAGRLDREFGVMVRAGLHCAPEAHRVLGTHESGAVRFSVGWATTEADVDAAIEGVDRIAGTRPVPVG
jgi:cysteine desulfurase family protein